MYYKYNINITCVDKILEKTIFNIVANNEMQTYLFSTENPKQVINKLKEIFTYIQAAGGVVENEYNEYLLIYRRNLWDLPKGKIELGENYEYAATREVKEETGIEINKIIKPLNPTLHAYVQNNSIIIKETYWYLMSANKKETYPQEEEEITKVIWLAKDNVEEFISYNTYPLIKDIIKSLTK